MTTTSAVNQPTKVTPSPGEIKNPMQSPSIINPNAARTASRSTNKPVSISDEVYIRRRIRPEEDYRYGEGVNVNDIKADQYKFIGASYSSGNQDTLRGLDFEEEKRLLPKILGIDPSSQMEWIKATKNYWANIRKLVPTGIGLKLEIGFTYPNKDIAEDAEARYAKERDIRIKAAAGTPIKLEDYILYRYCLVYGRVANDIEEIDKSNKIWFYIFSKAKETQENYEKLNLRRSAYEAYLGILTDKTKKVNIAILFNEPNAEKLNDHDLDILLDGFARTHPNKFLRIAKDAKTGLRALIERAIEKQKLTRLANTDLIFLGDVQIGQNVDEAVKYFDSPSHSKELANLKSQVKIFSSEEDEEED